jgi:prepilin-type N-terminal cleavage/methylation domain-containing protein
MNRKDLGFTLLEIVVVLVLISIIAATVFSRSIGTDRINFVGQVDKIRNHLRYAQSLAMKSLDVNSDKRWGIKCSANRYWLFNYENFGDDNTAISLPGQETDKISLSDLGVTMNAFTLFFDGLGKPYKTSYNNAVRFDNPLNITISAGSESSSLNVSPETGLIKTQ